MDPILFFCTKHEQSLLEGLNAPEKRLSREALENMTRGLRGWRILFRTLCSVRPHWLPPAHQKDSVEDLLKISQYVADLYVQADTLKKKEGMLGMDLSYLHEYTLSLAEKAEEKLNHSRSGFDRQFPGRYKGYLAEQMKNDNPVYLQSQLIQLASKRIKKAMKRLRKKNGIGGFMKLRRHLIDAIYYLDLLGFEDLDTLLRDASLFLEVWHNRSISLWVIQSYRAHHPKMACKYSGTLEILEDYMQQKVAEI